MMNENCNTLFNELWFYSDNADAMSDFVESIKYFVEKCHKGNIRIGVIDLHQISEKFPNNHIYIAYDDCGGAMDPTIYNAGDFVKYIQEIYNEYSEDLEPEEYWIDELKEILKKYQ